MRDYKIYIDGQQVGTIGNGETKNFTTTEGQHTVTAKIDWCSSPTISVNVNDNQTKTLKVGGFKKGNWLILIFIGLIILHFILLRYANFEFTIYFAAALFLWPIYYLTIGRKKYLTLDEI